MAAAAGGGGNGARCDSRHPKEREEAKACGSTPKTARKVKLPARAGQKTRGGRFFFFY